MSFSVPFNAPSIGDLEQERVLDALRSRELSGDSKFGRLAEEALREFFAGSPVLLTTSCTHALEMSAILSAIEPGDEVIVPDFTFVSSALAFVMQGAKPVFVDVDPLTLNLDYAKLEEAVTNRTKAICFVNYGGSGWGIDAIADFANREGIALVEDNAHGLGGSLRGRQLGTFGTMSTLSFHETKSVTSGEGGAIVLNDQSLLGRAKILREKGTNRSQFLDGLVDKYSWVDKGSSWVLSDLNAALLTAQLEQFESRQRRRVRIWQTYLREITPWSQERGFPVSMAHDDEIHACHNFHLRLLDRHQRGRFITHMRDRGVNVVFHYQSLSSSSFGSNYVDRPVHCPVSQNATETLVRLPLFAGLEDWQVEHTIESVLDFPG